MKRKRHGEKRGGYIFDYFQVSRSAIFHLDVIFTTSQEKGKSNKQI